ncbi:MAG: SURF1 family protein [Rhodobacteraceae bacterium]|nr:SURF1 family protein [Paracoccaceae bacterium]
MNKRMIAPAVFGIVGMIMLVLLGNWQIDRLAWKEAIIAEIDERLAAKSVMMPATPDPTRDVYLSVQVEGVMEPAEIHALASSPDIGPGYRIISPFVLADGRRIMVDRGIVPEAEKDSQRPLENGTLYGNLYWMQDDYVLPDPNLERNIWFTRSEGAMAEALGTEPILFVLNRTSLSGAPLPQPVGNNLPNSHLGYAVTWYLMALAWLGMSLYLLFRIKRKTV